MVIPVYVLLIQDFNCARMSQNFVARCASNVRFFSDFAQLQKDVVGHQSFHVVQVEGMMHRVSADRVSDHMEVDQGMSHFSSISV